MSWQSEVEELHTFFEAWFAGAATDLKRAEEVLDAGFTIVGPDGTEMGREAIVASIAAVAGRDPGMRIWTSHHETIASAPGFVVGSYREHHAGGVKGESTRISTAVFVRDESAPEGLRWLRVHETWLHQPG